VGAVSLGDDDGRGNGDVVTRLSDGAPGFTTNLDATGVDFVTDLVFDHAELTGERRMDGIGEIAGGRTQFLEGQRAHERHGDGGHHQPHQSLDRKRGPAQGDDESNPGTDTDEERGERVSV